MKRSISKISEKDFVKAPIWEWGEDDPPREEAWLRSTEHRIVPKGVATFVVRARVTLANGESWPGAVEVHGAGIRGQTIFTALLMFREGVSEEIDGTPRIAKKLERRLKVPATKLYPIRWTLEVKVAGERTLRSGEQPMQDAAANRSFFEELRRQMLKERGELK